MSRPEYQAPPDIYYNEEEAGKYTQNTRVIEIQSIMTERCLQLANLPNHPCLLLDIGCGSGLSGEIITEHDHMWIGIDISRDMLNRAVHKEVDGDLYNVDMGQGFKFRAGMFDGAISVSVLQWIFVAAKKSDNPFKRLSKFFQDLYTSLAAGARAVFQFYPDSSQQLEMAISTSMKAGFKSAVIVDYPDSQRRKKIYLVLCAGDGDLSNIKPMTGTVFGEDEEELDEEYQEGEKVSVLSKKSKHIQKTHFKNDKVTHKSKEWILKKKDRQRRQGKEVRSDTKYSGRKRNINF